jgi:two-component system chemotaxis response regulator CheY
MKQKILVVDDSVTARMFIKRCLEICGYGDAAILEMEDGLQAFECLKEDAEISLLLTDINMPHMDGMELLRKLEENRITLPIIAITSVGNEAKENELKEMGVKHIIKKPISPALLNGPLKDIFQEEADDGW